MLIEKDYDIKIHTSFKIGGKISEIYFPQYLDDIKDLPSETVVIGNLSNILISSQGCNLALFSTSKLNNTKIDGCKIIAGAGVKGPKLAQITAEAGFSGMEFMIGFPGSVGGEVFMNAGAHGQEISDIFKSAIVYDGQNIFELKKEDMDFSYRHSVCQDKKYVVLEAEFELTPDSPEKIKQRIAQNLEFRKNHQPSLAFPNCGSIFKNPENNSAGKLLDECGVKGLKTGGAKVWENHANFIINDGNATSIDVLKLMYEMKQRVKEKFNISLKPEIYYLGNKDEEENNLWHLLNQK